MKKAILYTFTFLLGMGSLHANGPSYGGPKIPIAPPCPDNGPCFSYNFIDLNYSLHDFDSPFIRSARGYGANFSTALGSSLFLAGGYDRIDHELDLTSQGIITDGTLDRYRLGLGYHRPIYKCVDWILEGGALYSDIEYERFTFLDEDRWGWYAGTGFRAMVANNVECYGNAYYSGEEGLYSWRFTPGLIFSLTESLGLKVGGDFYRGDRRALVLGGRLYY